MRTSRVTGGMQGKQVSENQLQPEDFINVKAFSRISSGSIMSADWLVRAEVGRHIPTRGGPTAPLDLFIRSSSFLYW